MITKSDQENTVKINKLDEFHDFLFYLFLKIIFIWFIFKVFIEFITIRFLFYVLFCFVLTTSHVGILAPWSGIEPTPLALESDVLTTGLSGKYTISSVQSLSRVRLFVTP